MGIIAGIYAKKIPNIAINLKSGILESYHKSKHKQGSAMRQKFKAPKRNLTLILIVLIASSTYILPLLLTGNLYAGLIIALRSALVILLWIYFLSPLLNKVLKTKNNNYIHYTHLSSSTGKVILFRIGDPEILLRYQRWASLARQRSKPADIAQIL